MVGWTNVSNLRGPTGDTGYTGPQGDTGYTGASDKYLASASIYSPYGGVAQVGDVVSFSTDIDVSYVVGNSVLLRLQSDGTKYITGTITARTSSTDFTTDVDAIIGGFGS